MVEVINEPHSEVAKAVSGSRQTYYDCGGGRKTFFCFLFILLLPFFVSVPIMLYQRISKGVWTDTWGLAVIAVVFAGLMLLILFELMFSLRAKVDIGNNAVSFTLPARGSGVVPLFFYNSRRIPFEEITEIETRREVYANTIAPMLMRAVRINLRTGERILLGYTNEADDDPKFPLPQIGRQIAERAGVEVVDKGNVLKDLHRRMFGLKDEERISEAAEIVSINRRHNKFLIGLVAVLLLLLLLGIGNDVWRESGDSGERGRTTFIKRN